MTNFHPRSTGCPYYRLQPDRGQPDNEQEAAYYAAEQAEYDAMEPTNEQA